MKNRAWLVVLMLVSVLPVVGEDKEEKVDDRIRESATVIKEILDVPDGIPKDLLNKAEMRGDLSVGQKGGVWRRRQLRAGTDHVPHGAVFFGVVERTGDVCAGSREFRFPNWSGGHRLRAAGDE